MLYEKELMNELRGRKRFIALRLRVLRVSVVIP